jgi:hypothetical protein
VVEVVAQEALLEGSRDGIGVVSVGGIIGSAEAKLALRGDGGDGVFGGVKDCGYG